MSAIFLSMIHKEDNEPTFPHLENWNKLTLTVKANQLLIANFLKMLAIIDFSNMSFKEVLSLSEEVITFLNQDSQLDRNSIQDIV